MAKAPKQTAEISTKAVPQIVKVDGLKIPPRKKARGVSTVFPFGELEVGQAFGIADRTAKSLQTLLGNTNRKWVVDQTDDDGNTVYETQSLTGVDGTVTVVNKIPLKPLRVVKKRFYAVDVDPHEYNGASVLIVREI